MKQMLSLTLLVCQLNKTTNNCVSPNYDVFYEKGEYGDIIENIGMGRAGEVVSVWR